MCSLIFSFTLVPLFSLNIAGICIVHFYGSYISLSVLNSVEIHFSALKFLHTRHLAGMLVQADLQQVQLHSEDSVPHH